MANVGGIDENSRRTLSALSSVDNSTIVNLWADPVTHRLLVDNANASISIGGTVTSGTDKSVLFVHPAGTLAQDNTNFNYDSTAKTLSLDSAGTNTAIHTGPAAGTTNVNVGGVGVEFVGTNNTSGGMNIILGNKSNGTSAFTSLFIQNDLADATGTHYGNIGMNSSTYNDNTFGTLINVANQFAMTCTDGPMTLGTFKAANSYINFAVGGSAIANEIGRWTSTGLTVGLTGTLTGAITFAGATSTSIKLQGQAIGSSSVLTLPTGTDTLVGLALTQALTNKTYNGLTVTSSTGTLTVTNAKTLTISNSLTLAGTDGKGINVGAATSRKILVGDGSNMVLSTETWATPGTSGNVLISDGTNWTSAATYSPTSVVLRTTKDMSSNTTTTIAHGLGRTPKMCIASQQISGGNMSYGAYDGSTNRSWFSYNNNTVTSNSDSYAIRGNKAGAADGGSNNITGVITWDGTNVIITYTLGGSPTGNMELVLSVY